MDSQDVLRVMTGVKQAEGRVQAAEFKEVRLQLEWKMG